MIRSLPIVFAAILAVPTVSAADLDAAKLRLMSANVLVLDAQDGKAIYAKAADEVTPIASLTKLMTAMVVLDANQPMDEVLSIDMDDFDFLKGSHSRPADGHYPHPRGDAAPRAHVLGEPRRVRAGAATTPGGMLAFVAAMNEKAIALGMTRTHYDDSTGCRRATCRRPTTSRGSCAPQPITP
jgi:D-alanyl-D-alanine endopeptidase (penicillin-binding protein 7)